MKKRILLAIPVFFAVVALFGLYGFVKDMRAYPGVAGNADAIVVLTGGMGRIEEGLMMLRRGKSRKMILSGVNEAADHDSIFYKGLNDGERMRIILEKRSTSTFENAREVRRLFTEHELKSMLLITSAYHMKRAYQTFRRIMPGDVEITAYPVESPNFDHEHWWGMTELSIVVPEFVKYCWYEVRFGIQGVEGA